MKSPHFEYPLWPFWAVLTAICTVSVLKQYLWLRLWHGCTHIPTICVWPIAVMVQCTPLVCPCPFYLPYVHIELPICKHSTPPIPHPEPTTPVINLETPVNFTTFYKSVKINILISTISYTLVYLKPFTLTQQKQSHVFFPHYPYSHPLFNLLVVAT